MGKAWKLHLITLGILNLLQNTRPLIQRPQVHNNTPSIRPKENHIVELAQCYTGIGPIRCPAVHYHIDQLLIVDRQTVFGTTSNHEIKFLVINYLVVGVFTFVNEGLATFVVGLVVCEVPKVADARIAS